MEFAIEITSDIPYIGVVFLFIKLLSFLGLDNFEGNTNICVAIKLGSTVTIGTKVVSVNNAEIL